MRLQKNATYQDKQSKTINCCYEEDGNGSSGKVPSEYESLIETAVQNAEGGLKSIKRTASE